MPASEGAAEARYFFGQAGPSVWRPLQQVHNPVRDGVVEDWSAAERLIECALRDGGGMRLDSLRDHPLLATEATWVPKEGRERLCELAFEGWEAPAYYSADRAVLSAFSAGKGTALVVDVGEDATTVTPVYDGFVIRKAIQKSPVGAAVLNAVLATTLRASGRPKLIASHYMIKGKQPVDLEAMPQAALRTERMPGHVLEGNTEPLTTDSFARHAEAQTLHEFKESVCAVYEQAPYNEDVIRARAPKAFEFPDGYNATYGNFRYLVPEVLFNPQHILPPEVRRAFASRADVQFHAAPKPQSSATIPLPTLREAVPVSHMIINAVNGCDADLLPHMLSNIVVVGGGSMMHGFADRLNNEMTALAQGVRRSQ